MSAPAWDPTQYNRFEAQRDRAALDKHAAGEPMAKLKALKARHDLSTDVTRFD